jgi:hypothetical protein
MNDLGCCEQGWMSPGGCGFRVSRASIEGRPQIKNEIASVFAFGNPTLAQNTGAGHPPSRDREGQALPKITEGGVASVVIALTIGNQRRASPQPDSDRALRKHGRALMAANRPLLAYGH